MFYTFKQNNSGGEFINDENVGSYVIIEADSLSEAVDRAKEVGLYWGGVRNGIDCPCCGDRWYPWADVSEIPCIYGCPFEEIEDSRDGYIHVYYADGRHVKRAI